MKLSIHDNIVYACLMDCGETSSTTYTLRLYTEYFTPDGKTEYTDVVFSNVLTHQFESISSKTVLFDIEEVSAQEIYRQNEALFKRLKNYSWPLLYQDEDDLLNSLQQMNLRGYRLQSACGFDGWALAEKMELQARSRRKKFE